MKCRTVKYCICQNVYKKLRFFFNNPVLYNIFIFPKSSVKACCTHRTRQILTLDLMFIFCFFACINMSPKIVAYFNIEYIIVRIISIVAWMSILQIVLFA